MNNSKLLQLLRSLNDRELGQFESYLSGFVDTESLLFRFYKYIHPFAPLFEDKKLSKEAVFAKIYPKETFKDVRVRELMSGLSKHLENYLILIEQTEEEFYTQLALLKQYRKRKLDNLYRLQAKQIEKLMLNDQFLNAESYKRKFLFADELNNHFEAQQVREHNEAINQKNENLDRYYFGTKLKTLSEIINRENILNAQFNKTLKQDIIRIVEENKNLYLDSPIVHCFYEVLLLLEKQDDVDQFNRTFHIINQYQKSFTELELKNLYYHLLNYCIKHVNKGSIEYAQKLFDLQKLLLQNKVLLDNNEISHISYRNIVTIGIKLKEYEWVEQFIADYKNNIIERFRENAYNLSQTNLLYAKKEFEQTISLLNQVEFTDVFYACSAKFTQTKAYYALKEFETLDYFVSAFQLYLKRNKEISDSFKKSSENFLKHFKKLLLIVKQKDYKENDKIIKKIKDLESNIKNEKIIANRSWLLEELAKIEL